MGTRGLLFIISGPAGTGKGMVIGRARTLASFDFSVSATTRAPRPGEIDGVHYHFIDRARFDEMLRGDELLEHAEYVGNCYGTPRAPVEACLAAGKNMILDIEVQGALQVKKKLPEAILVFIIPPDFETLLSRIRGRGTETDDVIARRMEKARAELEQLGQYDYVIVNREGGIDEAAAELIEILHAEQHKTARNMELKDTFFA